MSRRNKKACLKWFASRPNGRILETLNATETQRERRLAVGGGKILPRGEHENPFPPTQLPGGQRAARAEDGDRLSWRVARSC